MNNKGFAISGMLYSLLILFVTLFIGILSMLAGTKFSFDKLRNDIMNKLQDENYGNYNDAILNGADPVLKAGMIPVTINADGTVKKADLKNRWYSYSDKEWANAIILDDNYETLKANNKVIGTTRKDGYVSFDGVDDAINLGLENYDFGNEISLALKVKLNSLANQTIFSNYEGAGGGIYINNNKLTFDLFFNELGKYYTIEHDFELELGKWYTIVETYDGSNIKLYVNGNLIEINSISGTIKSSAYPFTLAANPNSNGYSGFGNFDVAQASIYDRALTEEEIQKGYNNNIKVQNTDGLLKHVDFSNNTYQINQIIPEDSISQYYTWIPRYKYKLWNTDTVNVYADTYETLKADSKITGTTKNAGYVSLDGTDDVINLGLESYDFGSQLTFSIKFKLSNYTADKSIIGNWESAGGGIFVKNDKVGCNFYINELSSYAGDISDYTIELNKWYTVVATYDGSNIKLYVNGSLVETFQATGTIKATAIPVAIGANPKSGGYTNYTSVDVAQASIHNRTLTQEEIAENYSSEINASDSIGVLKYVDFRNETGNPKTDTYESLKANNKVVGTTKTDTYVSFDGVDDAINLGLESYNFGNHATYALRFKTNSYGDVVSILGNWQSGGGGIFMNDNKIGFNFYMNELNDYAVCYTDFEIDLNTWYTAVETYDGENIRLYIDGNLIESISVTGTIKTTTLGMALGANPERSGYLQYSNIDVSQASIYNRALTEEEIQNGYSNEIRIQNAEGLLKYADFRDEDRNVKIDTYETLAKDGKIVDATNNDGYVSFDGTNDVINLGLENYSFGKQLTLALRVKMKNTTGTQEMLGNWQSGGGGIGMNAGKLLTSVYVDSTNTYAQINSNFEVEANRWYTIVETYDGTNLSLYVDGVLIQSLPTTGSIVTVAVPVSIGANPNASSYANYSNIDVTQAAIYNRALTQEEIKSGYSDEIVIQNSNALLKYVDFRNKTESIDIIFESKYTSKTLGDENGEYLTHPAFTFGDTELNGIWVAKFETGYNGATSASTAKVSSMESNKVIVKPNTYSWSNSTVSNMFYTILNMNTENNIFGLTTDSDIHMMKNTEWGAVTYLANSKYGKNSEVYLNNNSTYITGCGGDTLGSSENSVCTNSYGTKNDNIYNQSTSGNITGIFDMSGGRHEYVMGYTIKASTQYGRSGFTSETFPENKYIDIYSSINGSDYSARILGDATGEFGPFNNNISYPYSDWTRVASSSWPWFDRGGIYSDTIYAGLGTSDYNGGGNDSFDGGFRPVIS